jgi:rRNA-processing protein FCF1
MFINNIHKGYITKLGEIDSIQTVAILNNQLVYYAFTKDNVFKQQVNKHTINVFTFKGRYLSNTFQGIMPNIRAFSVLSAKEP